MIKINIINHDHEVFKAASKLVDFWWDIGSVGRAKMRESEYVPEEIYFQRFQKKFKRKDIGPEDPILERNVTLEKYNKDFLNMYKGMVKKYRVDYDDYDDCLGDCYLGYIKAVETFDRSKGVKLTTHIYNYIRYAILDHLKKQNKIKNNECALEDWI